VPGEINRGRGVRPGRHAPVVHAENCGVPEISRFYGIVIRMYHDDHAPPHFHAEYGDEEAVVDIRRLRSVQGRLRPQARRLVAEWAKLHRAELLANWDLLQSGHEPRRIRPLE
jgi:phosphomannomutase